MNTILGRLVKEHNYSVQGIAVEIRGNRVRVQFAGENCFGWFNREQLTLVN